MQKMYCLSVCGRIDKSFHAILKRLEIIQMEFLNGDRQRDPYSEGTKQKLYIHIHIHIHIYVYIMYVYIFMFMYVYIYIGGKVIKIIF